MFLGACGGNSDGEKLPTIALEVLAITRRPLSILELAWAVMLGAAQKRVTTMAALAELVDPQRVMSLIQPFVAHVDFNDVKKRQVRLVHQSVKEFIVREWASNRPGLQDLALSPATDQRLIYQRTGSLEAGILNICIKYLLLDDFGHNDLFFEEQAAIEQLPQESDLFNNDEEPTEYDACCTREAWEENMIRYDPTNRGFVYASCHWLEHFGAITVEPLPDLESIDKLCQARSTRLQNWIKQNYRRQCTIKPRFVFDSSLYDPLSITSFYGSEAMLLRDMLESSDFDEDRFLPNPAIGAADQILQWGDVSKLKMLFWGRNTGHQLQNLEFFRLIMKQWSISNIHYQDRDAVFDLVDDVLDISVKEQCGNELLYMAASMGCMSVIRRSIDRAQYKAEFKTKLLWGSPRQPQSISLASQCINRLEKPSWDPMLMLWNTCWGNRALKHTFNTVNHTMRMFCSSHPDSVILLCFDFLFPVSRKVCTRQMIGMKQH